MGYEVHGVGGASECKERSKVGYKVTKDRGSGEEVVKPSEDYRGVRGREGGGRSRHRAVYLIDM